MCVNLVPCPFGSHLCERVFDELDVKADKENSLPGTDSPALQPSASSPLKRSRSNAADSSFSGAYSESQGQWTAAQQEEFVVDFCKLLVANDISWNFAINPQTHRFFAKYRPEAIIPEQRVLSGRILDQIYADIEAKVTDTIKGKYATGQCDGFKTMSKTPVITSMATVENQV